MRAIFADRADTAPTSAEAVATSESSMTPAWHGAPTCSGAVEQRTQYGGLRLDLRGAVPVAGRP